MKKILVIILAITSLASAGFQVYAQGNIPDGSVLSGSPTNTVSYPLNFDNVTPALPSTTLYNYTRVYRPTEPMTTIPAYSVIGTTKLSVATKYMDGWGRPLQSVVQLSPLGAIYQPHDNRAMRTQVGYLPIPMLLPNGPAKFRKQIYTEQKSYYSSNFAAEGYTAYATSKSYSDNGLQTTLSCAPGKEFTGENRGVKTTVQIGSSSDISGQTTLYMLEYSSSNNTICKTGTYATYEYTVARTEGQHNREILQFTDKSGKLLCKKERVASGSYMVTYYVYNLLGQLTNIVPPVQSAYLVNNTCISNVIPASTPAQVYTYEYNQYGQSVSSQTPGKEGLDRVVYDKYNRTFLSQSPTMATAGKAYFTLYDKLGRPVMTGVFDETHNMSQSYYDDIINGTTSLPAYYDPQSQAIADDKKLEYWLIHDMPVNEYPQDQNQEPFLAGCEIHTLNYYDRYDITPANQVNFSTAYSTDYLTDAGSELPVPYYAMHGRLVATQTRILDNGISNNWNGKQWIKSVFFYDEKGRAIQTHTLNPWQQDEWDIAYMQYNFSGQNILSILHHKGTGLGNKGSNSTTIFKKYAYNAYNGRLETSHQKIDNGAWYLIDNILYDRLGHVASNSLGNVEIQQYSYDIKGQLTGINENRVLTGPLSQTSSMTFACKLNSETGFSQKRYDGKLSGYQWRSAGSAYPMAYGYNYDDAGRMTRAEFRYQNTSGSWVKTAMDYTVSNLAYDVNGNIQSMKQRGDDNSSTPSPIDIDDLAYTYDATGTRLMSVSDAAGGVTNIKIHDFADNNTSGNDFLYDKNGNLNKDLNRGINNISYTFQDMPAILEKTNNDGDVKNIYTADGTLLQKTITDNTQVNPVVTTYHYWGPFVYKNDDLEMVMHDEGRCRYDGTDYAYDYFVRDHLGNVRNIVKGTMSYGQVSYHAGFELIAATVEESVFDQIGVVRNLNPQGTPQDLNSGILNGSVSNQRIGAAIAVHAMAGEKFNVKGYGYYDDEDVEDYNTYPMPEYMLESLTDALTAAVGEGGDGPTSPLQTMNNLLTNTNYNLYEGMKLAATNSNFPRAYLNYLVFDENFNLQPDYSHVVQINGGPGAWQLMEIAGDQEMPINGYLMTYFSNESHMDVGVDNLNIINYESSLLEEQLYYPHGMVVQGGGQGNTNPANQYLFQGNKLQEELNLYINDFNFRQYDAQIGRFMAIDPLAESGGQEGLNPYQFCYNDPANYTDPLGLRGGQELMGGGNAGNGWFRNLMNGLGSFFSGGSLTLGEFHGVEIASIAGDAAGLAGSSGPINGSGPGGSVSDGGLELWYANKDKKRQEEQIYRGRYAMGAFTHGNNNYGPVNSQSVQSNPNSGAVTQSRNSSKLQEITIPKEIDEHEKFNADWNYILHGNEGTALGRYGELLWRDIWADGTLGGITNLMDIGFASSRGSRFGQIRRGVIKMNQLSKSNHNLKLSNGVRVDLKGRHPNSTGHYNKATKTQFGYPHTYDPKVPGGVRKLSSNDVIEILNKY